MSTGDNRTKRERSYYSAATPSNSPSPSDPITKTNKNKYNNQLHPHQHQYNHQHSYQSRQQFSSQNNSFSNSSHNKQFSRSTSYQSHSANQTRQFSTHHKQQHLSHKSTVHHSNQHSTTHTTVPFNKKKNKANSQLKFPNSQMSSNCSYLQAVLDGKKNDNSIILCSSPDLFAFNNEYEKGSQHNLQQHIPDRSWLYNPALSQSITEETTSPSTTKTSTTTSTTLLRRDHDQDHNLPSYTFNSQQLIHGIPLFPPTSSSQDKFTVMSYNVLSSLHISENEYRSTPATLLSCKLRLPKVYSQIASLRPTFVALQEVDCPPNTYIPLLNTLGYQATFKLRRNPVRQVSGEGLILAWDASEWECLAQGGVEYSSYPNKPLCKEQLAIVALLQNRRDPAKNICLVTTHIVFNPKRINIKSAQLQMMLNGVYAWLTDLQGQYEANVAEIRFTDANGEQFSFPSLFSSSLDNQHDQECFEPDVISANRFNQTELKINQDNEMQINTPHTTNPTKPAQLISYHKQLSSQFNLHTTDLSSILRPVIITRSLLTSSQQMYGFEYTMQPNHFYIPSISPSTQAPIFSQLDLTSPFIKSIHRLNTQYTIHDIFSQTSLTDQSTPIFNTIVPSDSPHLFSMDPIDLLQQRDQQDPKTYPQLDLSNILRLESIDFNNYTTLARAIHLHTTSSSSQSLQNTATNSMPDTSLSRQQQNRFLTKQHIREINTMLCSAINCIDLRIFMESMKPTSSGQQDPTSYNDHSLFQHIIDCNPLYRSWTPDSSLEQLSVHPTPQSIPQSGFVTKQVQTQLLPLLLASPTTGAEINVTLPSNKPMTFNRLPPQTTLTHVNRPLDLQVANVPITSDYFNIQNLLPTHTLNTSVSSSPYYHNIRQRKLKGLRQVFFKTNQFGKNDDNNSAMVFTGDFNASVDSTFVSFLATAVDLDVHDAIVKTSPTFVGIELEKNAKSFLRDMSNLCYQRVASVLSATFQEKNSNQTVSKTPSRSRMDFDPKIGATQNDCFIHLITHAFTALSQPTHNTSLSCGLFQQAITSSPFPTNSGIAPASTKHSKSTQALTSSSSINQTQQQPHQHEHEHQREHDQLNAKISYSMLKEMYSFYFSTFVDSILSVRSTLLAGPGRNPYLRALQKQSQTDQISVSREKTIFQGLADANSILNDHMGSKTISKSRKIVSPAPTADTRPDELDFQQNPLFSILSPMIQSKALGENDLRKIQTKFSQYVFIRSIFQQFIHQNRTALLSVHPPIDLNISPHCARSSPEFNYVLESIRQHHDTEYAYDNENNFNEFIDQLELSFTMTSLDISTHISELLHTNSKHTAAIRHPLMSLCYHFSTQYTKSFFKQLTIGLPCHTRLFPSPHAIKLSESPSPINPFDTPLNIHDNNTNINPIQTLVHPFGTLILPYQQPYLPRKFRFSSVQERGKTMVDHILVSQHTIPTILNHIPSALQTQSNLSPSTLELTVLPTNPLHVHGILDMIPDDASVSRNFFLPDTREGSDHLSVMASLQWNKQ